MKYTINKGCHSVYSLRFHYICCVKYRRKVLTPEVTEHLKKINIEISAKLFLVHHWGGETGGC